MLAFSTFAQQSVAIVLRQYTVDDLAPSLNRTERYAQIDGTTLLGQGLSTTGSYSWYTLRAKLTEQKTAIHS